MAATVEEALGTGRRKSSVARVRIREGSGKITINKRDLDDFPFRGILHRAADREPSEADQHGGDDDALRIERIEQDRKAVLAPLEHCEVRDSVDVIIRCHGGGTTGQAGACMQGIARALLKHDSDLAEKLRENHFLTRDSRMKERKKPGLHGARRGTQFSKR